MSDLAALSLCLCAAAITASCHPRPIELIGTTAQCEIVSLAAIADNIENFSTYDGRRFCGRLILSDTGMYAFYDPPAQNATDRNHIALVIFNDQSASIGLVRGRQYDVEGPISVEASCISRDKALPSCPPITYMIALDDPVISPAR